ncbi:hypothetical protein MVES1_000848 [Malassezia vespertilionis]|uniref:uncharacterized protein n=1 Tax=Malassezia vespertilionis TaxID=2020962 RepID=UPI0024B1BFCB|nr:uncharacterized protein MVES1_000848 [Malassezia vespertilionis]WFD05518.1 hypothetical protein MVES1_000848 [Malassezia vespertilionis]
MDYTPKFPRYNTAVKDSFAYDTAIRRWPSILTQAVDSTYRRCHELATQGAHNAHVEEAKSIIEKIGELKHDLMHDKPLVKLHVSPENAPHLDGTKYRVPSTTEYDTEIQSCNPSWMQSEWLFAECYLYRRLRRLFETSMHWQGFDPFFQTKLNTFRASGQGIQACATMMEEMLVKSPTHSAHDPASQFLFDEIVSSSLWGNATDLSLLTNLDYADLQKLQATTAEQRAENAKRIIVNDMDTTWNAVRLMENGRVDIVLDNAGFELITDMLLADWLLTLRGTIPRPTTERAAAIQIYIEAVRERISTAARKVSVKAPQLLAVSKLQPASDVMAAYEQTAQRHFGENYAQELVEKASVLPLDIQWHLIGGLQSNKAKILASVPNLYAVESIASAKLATSLEKTLARPENAMRRKAPLYVYVQVNTSAEAEKSGVPALTAPWQEGDQEPPLVALVQHILLECPHLRLVGLMTIGALANSKQAREGENPDFEALVASRKHLLASLKNNGAMRARFAEPNWWTPTGNQANVYDTLLHGVEDAALQLSMGMSADLEAAVAYGSNQVRIGSDCFGSRGPKHDADAEREEELRKVNQVPLVKEVVFHTKNMPWFVSDTCVPDVWYTLDKLQDPAFFAEQQLPSLQHIQAMAARWKRHFSTGAFRLAMPHDAPLGADAGPLGDFWTQPASYGHLPALAPALLQDLQMSGLVIFKGDLNYRKLTQDAAWPPVTSFSTALGPLYGRIPLVALRTCKADVCVGLAPGQAEALSQRDPAWRTNGHWALIQFAGRNEILQVDAM